ncbi:hypothetical protein [Bosea sp. 124]|uniref:hypothetical protein n=1 Tax=Bosea sp. 124 TaxID=2135642 RepID=UPI0011B26597|nr:hypothetical protein [Bosea sp. 124]
MASLLKLLGAVIAKQMVSERNVGSSSYRLLTLRILTFIGLSLPSIASVGAAEQALVFMNGTWIGEGYMLTLDTDRMQGNQRADLPFQREPLLLRNVSAKMVVFDIGTSRFIGLFDRDNLTLTGLSFDRNIRLRRVKP